MTYDQTTQVVQLPLPDKLSPPKSNTLLSAVRRYFYELYNTNPTFKTYLASVGNKDAVTGNRFFDRHEAVKAIRDAAAEARDKCFDRVTDGIIYKHMTHIMNSHEDLKLQARRRQYEQLTQAAE